MKRTTTPISLALTVLCLSGFAAAQMTAQTPAGAATTPPSPKSVELAAGSVNGLAAAIAQAGPGGTVLLKSGVHQEAGEVLVTAPVTITGEPGAILESATSPVFPNTMPVTVTAALHFKGAPGATVSGIWFQPPGTTLGSAAVILEDSPGAQVLNNRMTQLQYGVIVQRADDAVIRGNTISTPTNWDLDASDPTRLFNTMGILVMTGQRVQVTGNQVSAKYGIFLCDGPGEAAGNIVTGSFAGIVLCHIPDIWFLLSGSKQASKQPAVAWYTHDNIASNNLRGILVIDGAHDNMVANNAAVGNRVYDIELAGDTKRLAPLGVPLAPSSHDNTVVTGAYAGLVVKDCGQNDQIIGAVKLVDHSVDPCN